MSTQQLAADDQVHIGGNGDRFHGTRGGLPACTQLVWQLHESEREIVTVAEARRRGKTACQRCLGGVR